MKRPIQNLLYINQAFGFLLGLLALSFFVAPFILKQWHSYHPPTVGILSAAPKPSSFDAQKLYTTALTRDQYGNLWIGTEGQGVWRQDVNTGRLRQFTTNDGLGDEYGYSLIVDKNNRIWVGHLRAGVSVYNGAEWQNFRSVGSSSKSRLMGPPGDRVFALAVSPVSGDVWIATEVGLCQYSPESDKWSYYYRSDGLPAGRATSLAFDTKGYLYIGTECDGIVIGSAADSYRSWQNVRGPDQMPVSGAGAGLPTNLINAIVSTSNGTVYAGTTHGLAWSEDHGKTWKYIRGRDYASFVRGRIGGPPSSPWQKSHFIRGGYQT